MPHRYTKKESGSRPFPPSGDNFRMIGEVAHDLLKNVARKQSELQSSLSETAKSKESRNG